LTLLVSRGGRASTGEPAATADPGGLGSGSRNGRASSRVASAPLAGVGGAGSIGNRCGEITSVVSAAGDGLPDATAASPLRASTMLGRSTGSARSSRISSAVSGPACRGGLTLPAATAYSSARVFSPSPNGECPSTAV
jgi:hypothetical protein